ncbi:MAG TPA: hypothetical protein VJ044_09920, partial [Candidatus Hodarchaeales archaeon]|nr:hypothetical protein [Candidatus Hodarchaeales archaeon]
MGYIGWFSLATSSGLSILSLGTPGLKSDLDSDVFAGGISAVSSLLSSEIGSNEKVFLGGGETRKFGRFVLSGKEEAEVVSQFLIMSNDETKIPEMLVSTCQDLAVEFGQRIVNSDLWTKAVKSFSTLTALDVLDFFAESLTVIRRKHKGISSDGLLDKKFDDTLRNLVTEYHPSTVLTSIREMEPTAEDLKQKITPNREKLQGELVREMLALILADDPVTFLMRSRPAEVVRDGSRMLNEYKDQNSADLTAQHLKGISSALFKGGEVSELLEGVSVFDLRRSRSLIQRKIENEFIVRISKKSPIVLLLNPSLISSIGDYQKFVDSQTDIVFKEF